MNREALLVRKNDHLVEYRPPSKNSGKLVQAGFHIRERVRSTLASAKRPSTFSCSRKYQPGFLIARFHAVCPVPYTHPSTHSLLL